MYVSLICHSITPTCCSKSHSVQTFSDPPPRTTHMPPRVFITKWFRLNNSGCWKDRMLSSLNGYSLFIFQRGRLDHHSDWKATSVYNRNPYARTAGLHFIAFKFSEKQPYKPLETEPSHRHRGFSCSTFWEGQLKTLAQPPLARRELIPTHRAKLHCAVSL